MGECIVKRYHARDLLWLSENDIWDIPDGPMLIEFDNGEVIECTGRETHISSYAWDIHRQYPLTPMLPEHHINGKRFNADTYLDILSSAVWLCKDVYDCEIDIDDLELQETAKSVMDKLGHRLSDIKPVDMEEISESVYEICNHTYNELSIKLEEYPSSLDATDWVQVLDHPPIVAFREKMYECGGKGAYNPDAFNELVKTELLHSKDLNGNGVANLTRGKQVKAESMSQCVGSRGRATDITNDIFPNPILGGFGTGLDSVVDLAKETRSASLSSYFQKEPMKKSEYFNRNLQLSSATLSRLHYVDCGSRHYIPILIASSKTLRDMNGIAFLDETKGSERIIRKNMKNLIGKMVKVRSVLTCEHPDRGGVCVRCFGEIGYSIPRHTNVGHVSASEMQSKVGQLLLSNKHYLASAVIAAMQIQEHDALYIRLGKEDNHIYLTDRFKGLKYRILVNHKEAINLGDVKDTPDVDKLSPFRVSSLSEIIFTYTVDGIEQTIRLDCSFGTRNGALSSEFLHYVKKQGWRTTDEGDYIIEMDSWDVEQPMLELPLKHFSTLDYMLAIEKFIKGGEAKEKESTMINQETHEKAVTMLSDLISMKLEVNFSYVQTIYLAALVQSRANRDYRLPMPRYNGEPAHYRQIMRLRSIAATMAFQEQTSALYGLESYLVKLRPVHPFDQLVFG